MGCITGSRYTMYADVLRQAAGTEANLSDGGRWVLEQDDDTLQVVRRWVPLNDDSDPGAPKLIRLKCLVTGIIDGGVRAAGTGESFGTDYESTDYAQMLFGTKYVISQRDRVVNVRNAKTGKIIWLDEELGLSDDNTYKSTVFNVEGVTPITDPFGAHIENFARLKKVT